MKLSTMSPDEAQALWEKRIAFPRMLEELIEAGRPVQRAATDMERAIDDGRLNLFDLSDCPWPQQRLRAAAIEFVKSYARADRASYDELHLGQDVFGLRPEFEFVFGLNTAAAETPSLKNASQQAIRSAIRAAYDAAETEKRRAPNIKALPSFVQPILKDKGLTASKNQIAKIGGANEFKNRRLRPGRP